jgi:hypothetical protein
MNGRVHSVICLGFLLLALPLSGESGDELSREETVRRNAQFTGGALGLATVTLYAVGPFTGMDFQDHPVASLSMVSAGSAAALGGSVLYSTLFADAIIESKAGPVDAGLEGILAGALAGGMTNGLAFGTMFGIGVPSGVIKMNDMETLDTWYEAASLGFLGGFMYGMFFGALAGAIGGPVISISLDY